MSSMITKNDNSNKDIIKGSVWIEHDGVKYFGPGPYELLRKIDETGSIHEAAKRMGLSYRKAWIIINRMNQVTGKAMVITRTGGTQGGGSEVSPEAKKLMTRYHEVNRRFTSFLEKESIRIH
jgi:molybdate transport system regulatory protein